MRVFNRLWLVLALMALPFVVQAEEAYEEGVDYFELVQEQPTNDPAKIEVVELFWYGCPHCNDFEPQLNGWLEKRAEDVDFIRVPATFRPIWKFHARIYYTAEVLGVLDKIHGPMFHAIHQEHARLDNPMAVEAFFIEHAGVTSEAFRKAYEAFPVVTKARQAELLVKRYEINGVPAMIVNGKYRIAGGSHEKVLRVVDYLIAKERAAK